MQTNRDMNNISTAAEGLLENAVSKVGRFTGKAFKAMVTSVAKS